MYLFRLTISFSVISSLICQSNQLYLTTIIHVYMFHFLNFILTTFKLVILHVELLELAQGPTLAHVSLVGLVQFVIHCLPMNFHLSTTIVLKINSNLEMAISATTNSICIKDCLRLQTLTDLCCWLRVTKKVRLLSPKRH